MNKMNKKGFTLIEMLVVIAIIAVLVSIIVPVVGNSTKKAKAAADAANLRSFAASIAVDYLDDSAITATNFTDPGCESVDGAKIYAYVTNGEIEAFFVKDSSYYSVDDFAAVAKSGDDLAATGAAGTTKLFPAA